MSKILVTGSNGTLGQPLVEALKVFGHEVFTSDTQHSNADKYTRCDVSDFRQVQRLFEAVHPEYVYHLAAEFGRINGELYYEQVWRTNAIGTRNIIEVCIDSSAKLIFASSSEIYGEAEEKYLHEELSEYKPLHQTNDYAISKWVNEQQIRNSRERYGLQAMTLRFFNAYGPGEHYHPYRSVVCLFCYRAMNSLPYDVYRGYYRTFMYISDFVPTLARACERFKDGAVYNIGGTDYRSVEELSNIVLENLGKNDAHVTYLDSDSHNIVSKRPDINRARAELSHNPLWKLEHGVPQTIEWLKSQ